MSDEFNYESKSYNQHLYSIHYNIDVSKQVADNHFNKLNKLLSDHDKSLTSTIKYLSSDGFNKEKFDRMMISCDNKLEKYINFYFMDNNYYSNHLKRSEQL